MPYLVPLLWATLIRLLLFWMMFVWEMFMWLRLFPVVQWEMDQLLPLQSVRKVNNIDVLLSWCNCFLNLLKVFLRIVEHHHLQSSHLWCKQQVIHQQFPTQVRRSCCLWLALWCLKFSYSAISVYVAVGGAIAIILTVLLTVVVVYCICKDEKKSTTSHNGSITGNRTMYAYRSWTMKWLFFFSQAIGCQNNRKVMYYMNCMCLWFLIL